MKSELDREAPRQAPPHQKSHAGFLILLVAACAALAAGIFYELKQREARRQSMAAAINDGATRPLVVNVDRVRKAPAQSTLELPCQTMPLVETPVYARADGYVVKRGADIGDRVKKGQLLFELDTPELDQQIVQARAALAQSKAALRQYEAALAAAESNRKLAEVTAKRWKNLTDKGVFARQDLDEKNAAFELSQANENAARENIRAAESTVAASEANLARLEDLKKFDRLEAPFDGVVTYRNLQSDIGTLITAGNTGSREMMRIAQIATLRVFVPIPQSYAAEIHENFPADLTVDELPGRVFHSKVEAMTHSVDQNSRTMQAELMIRNEREALLPGMYAKAHFKLPHAVDVLMLPADALLLPKEGPRVAVVGEDRRVHFQPVTIGRDYGAEIEIDSGLKEGDFVVLNPTDEVREGVVVEPKERK
ncbi:MAG TPA: efflux RND transporter periplasmic adaptor subunit [Bryobacteraceae bacterium]|jgi:RND family efflux transporter MFP subunit|nr:efflux RND transporter periplasmic adaptor subunit [Bryobacteraceae bacterium]